jgi:hypothetical protein
VRSAVSDCDRSERARWNARRIGRAGLLVGRDFRKAAVVAETRPRRGRPIEQDCTDTGNIVGRASRRRRRVIYRKQRTSRKNRGQVSLKASDTALYESLLFIFLAGYWPVTANHTPSASPASAGDVIRTIGAMQWDGSFTVPAMSELPAASAANVLVKKSIPLFESAGS